MNHTFLRHDPHIFDKKGSRSSVFKGLQSCMFPLHGLFGSSLLILKRQNGSVFRNSLFKCCRSGNLHFLLGVTHERVLVLMVAMMLAFATTAMAGDGSLEKVQKAGKLVIGLDDTFAPMGFRQDDGTLVGFDVDAAEEVGKRLGLKIEWQPTAWSGVIHSLNAKKFDCIWNGMTITPEREKAVSFSKPYIMDGQIAVIAMGNKSIKAHKDLGGKVVGVQKGSPLLRLLSPQACTQGNP